MNFTPDPFLLKTYFISIRWYGLLIALGILLAYVLSLREARRKNINESSFDTIFLITTISGVLGARLGFVFQNTQYFFENPIEILKITDGGLSIHGALILGILGLVVSSLIIKTNPYKMLNIISPQVLLGGAIGRWGNFFNQEIFGKPTNFFLKIFIDESHRPLQYSSINYFHPVFLYESVLLLLAYLLYLVLKRKLEKNAFVYTIIAYSIIRIAVEFLRIDYKPIVFGLDLAQILSISIIIFAFVMKLIFRKSDKIK